MILGLRFGLELGSELELGLEVGVRVRVEGSRGLGLAAERSCHKSLS